MKNMLSEEMQKKNEKRKTKSGGKTVWKCLVVLAVPPKTVFIISFDSTRQSIL